MNDYSTQQGEKQVGDTAVDGVIGGLTAGAAMMLFLVIAGLLDSAQPQQTMGYFDPSGSGGWVTGLLAHFAISAIYGALFALLQRVAGRLWPAALRVRWLIGLSYGLVLLALAFGMLSSTAASWLNQIPGWSLALAHVAYGLVLALQLGKDR